MYHSESFLAIKILFEAVKWILQKGSLFILFLAFRFPFTGSEYFPVYLCYGHYTLRLIYILHRHLSTFL